MLSIRYPVLWAGAVVALMANAALAAPPAKPARPTKAQIAKWIKELGDADFETREEASMKLWQAGSAAKEALELALTSDDVEVKRRAREVLAKFKWGIYPDTPKKIIALITDYQTADTAGKPAAVKKFLAAGVPGVKALRDVARSETKGEYKTIIFAEIATESAKSLPRLLADKDYDMVEALLEVAQADDHPTDAGTRNYVAYWLLRGKVAERIAHYQRLADKGLDAKKNYEMVALLQRAAGNLVAARQAAEKAGHPKLVEACLYEAGDWKALARLKDITLGGDSAIAKLGYRAAYHRLAGNTKEFEEALTAIRSHAKSPAGKDDQFGCAKALLINDRPTEGLALLVGDNLRLRFDILVAQLKIADALTLVDKAGSDKKNAELEVLKARTLYGLGETDKAREIFERLAKEIKSGGKEDAWEALVEAEYRVGLHDKAFEHLARILEIRKDRDSLSLLFPKLFGDRAETAEILWTFHQQTYMKGGRKPGASLQILRALLAGKLDAKDLTNLVKAGQTRAKAIRDEAPPAGNAELRRAKEEEADRLLIALADAARTGGQDRLALACLEMGKTRLALVRLGDALAAKKEWDKAADRYRQAWETDRMQPLPLFLRGWALTQGGNAKDGKNWIELSHWLPLGNGDVRRKFTLALAQRGHDADVQRENELLLRTGEVDSYPVGEALRRRAFYDPDRKDPLKVALRHEQSMLRCLRSDTRFTQGGAYVGVPAMIHSLRARGLLLAGKTAEAEKEAALARAAQPGYVELPINLVPALDKLGHKKEAAALFDQTLATYEKLCRDYPRCAWAHNSAAWMSACCRRDLDKALTHARKAVELAPTNAGYADTLAEIYFQRGDKDKAIQSQKKAIALDPKKPYFRKQLKRIEAGDPAAERPPENEG